MLTIKTKRKKFPSVDFKKEPIAKGALPDYHPLHDNFGFQSHEDFSTELKIFDAETKAYDEEGNGKLNMYLHRK